MDLSIVIPVFNEKDNLAPLLHELRQHFDGRLDYEVIFVDDGSTDGTGDVLGGLAAGDPRVRVVTHSQNLGQSAGLLSGVRAARADLVGSLDGDGQNDPADLMRFWERAIGDRDAAELYIGNRTRRQDSRIRLLSSRVANGVRSRLLHDGVPDTGCGIKLFRRDTFLALPYFDHMHRFLPALVRREGGKVVSIPVRHRPRTRGRSKYGIGNRLWVGIFDLLGVMWLLRRRRLPAGKVEAGRGR